MRLSLRLWVKILMRLQLLLYHIPGQTEVNKRVRSIFLLIEIVMKLYRDSKKLFVAFLTILYTYVEHQFRDGAARATPPPLPLEKKIMRRLAATAPQH
jgi:hypothetical protein